MSSTKRQLVGVDESLDWRPLEFVDEIPQALVCTLCGVIPGFLEKILPCCHVFCPACYEKITQRERICPVDRRPFLSDAVESLGSSGAGLKELRVRCPNSARGCTFVNKLSKLKHHFLEQCRLGEVQCPQCEMTMPQTEALDHNLQHCSGSPAGMPAVVRKSTPLNLESEAAASGGSSRDNSSGFSGGSSSSRSRRRRRRRKKRGKKSSSVPKASSAETVSAAAVGKDQLVAMIKDYLQDDAGSSVRSVSSGSSREPSRENSLVHSSSKAKPCEHKMAKATERTEGVSKVPSEEDQFLGKVDSAISKTQKALSTAATSKEQQPSTSGASSTPTTVKPTPGPPRSKTAASTVPRRDPREASSRPGRSGARQLRAVRVRRHLAEDRRVVPVHRGEPGTGTPWNESGNMRLPLVPNPDSVPTPPHAHLGRWDFWSPTKELELRDLKARGFLSSGSLCVAVEVE
ncbi:hypothetical protein HPB48_008483 [Haemaphysalis longicornis]|uniref:RING-type domain-containing protein n=1 Tax=Haemaphysalis longicornis TaxID=44386 RepID=A0A9J6FN64_HAELO|nr:hypothetical protein HPB48_008483 [Haemaphysalis longicornis]